MNVKILKHVKAEGFCCAWAFFEAKRQTLTSVLHQELIDSGCQCTVRALRYHRAAHRAGDTKCEKRENCLAKKIRDSRTIP